MDFALTPIEASFSDLVELITLLSLLLIPVELVWLALRRRFNVSLVKEMGASYSTFPLQLLTQGLAVVVALVRFSAVSLLIPWAIPVTWRTVGLAVVGAEICYYWNHRFGHEIRLLWSTHSVHHSSKDYNSSVSFRILFLDQLYEWVFYIPLILIVFDPLLVLLGWRMVVANQTWLHTELIGRLPVLDSFLNTPSNHRVHHGSDPEYLDKNYGGITVILDRVFGAYQVELDRPAYGLTKQIGTSNP